MMNWFRRLDVVSDSEEMEVEEEVEEPEQSAAERAAECKAEGNAYFKKSAWRDAIRCDDVLDVRCSRIVPCALPSHPSPFPQTCNPRFGVISLAGRFRARADARD